MTIKEVITADQAPVVREEELATCASDFWYFAQFLTTDDEERELRRPFPLPDKFVHLDSLHQAAEKDRRLIILKPRRMQVSMYFCARMLWRAKFCKQPDVYYGGYSAMDETLALYQLYRIKQMHDRLPGWLQIFNPMIKDTELKKEFEGGGKIHGFPLKRVGAQGFGFSEYLFDEAAWQEAAATTYAGLIFSIGQGKIFIVSTPNGEEGMGKFFHDVWHCKNERYTNYTRLEFDSRENPEHDDQWHSERRIECGDPHVYAQMIEKSFVSPEGDVIFPEFDSVHQVSRETLPIVEGRPLYVCWDFGYDWPAVVLMQRSAHDQWLVLREFCGQSIDFGIFCKLVLEQCNAMYDREKTPEIHCIDPAGLQRYHQKAESGAVSDAHEIRKRWARAGQDVQIRPGVQQVGTREHEGPRLKEVRSLMRIREDGKFPLVVDPQCTTVKDGFATGYVKDKYGKPVKNRFSHPMDAIQYGVTAYNRMVNPNIDQKKYESQKYKRLGFRTGR